MFRLELERILRTPYRNVIPLQQQDLCCCQYYLLQQQDEHQQLNHHQQQQLQQQQLQQQLQQQQEGGVGSLEGSVVSHALLPSPLWHYRGAPGGPSGVSGPPLAISFSACSSPRTVPARDPSDELGLEGPLLEAPAVGGPLAVAAPAAATTIAAAHRCQEMHPPAAAAVAAAAASSGFPLSAIGAPTAGPQRTGGPPRKSMPTCSSHSAVSPVSPAARRSSPRRSLGGGLLGAPQGPIAATTVHNISNSSDAAAAAAKGPRGPSSLKGRNGTRRMSSHPSSSSSNSSSSENSSSSSENSSSSYSEGSSSSSSDSDAGTRRRGQKNSPNNKGGPPAIPISPRKALDRAGGGPHGGVPHPKTPQASSTRHRNASSPAAAARLLDRGGPP